MNIALVGLGPESHDDAPWDDPDWEIWGLAWDADWIRCDVTFEIHEPSLWRKDETRAQRNYLERLQQSDGVIYMQERHKDIPASLAYPLKETEAETGINAGSSIAHMLSLAILEEPQKIGLWGVTLSESRYDHQRPNLAYLMGFAQGRGIEVEVHGVDLLALPLMYELEGYKTRYGYED